MSQKGVNKTMAYTAFMDVSSVTIGDWIKRCLDPVLI